MKRLLTFALSALLLASPLSALAFTDISAPDVRTAADTLAALDVISGYDDGLFHPGQPLTRAQFAKIAVLCLQQKNAAVLYQSYTIFPDVRTNHWAVGYVNAAVKTCKILSGYPDGTFKPDNSIVEAEAITICLRMLGYAEADIGPFWPADYVRKAAEIGLTNNMEISPAAVMNRGQAVLLLANMLVTKTFTKGTEDAPGAEGDLFAKSLGQSAAENVYLLATEQTDLELAEGVISVSEDGAEPEQRTAAGKLPASLVGYRGIMLTGQDGRVTAFVPYQYSVTPIVVKGRTADSLTGENGGKLLIPKGTTVALNGTVTTYDKAWVDIRVGSTLSFFYDKKGLLMYIGTGQSTVAPTGSRAVVLSGEGEGTALLQKHFSAELVQNTPIYKYGRQVPASLLSKNDVVTYNATTRRFDVCNQRVTGTLQECSPSVERAQRISLYGATYQMQEGYLPDLTALKDKQITLLFAPDGTVAAVKPESEAPAVMTGYVTQGKGDTATVVLSNGRILTASGDDLVKTIIDQERNYDYTGFYVEVTGLSGGRMGIKPVTPNATGAELNLVDMTLGGAMLDESVALYDCYHRGRMVTPISREDLMRRGGSVPAKYVMYTQRDGKGTVVAVVLDGYTCEAYQFGVFSDEDGYTLSYDSTAGTGKATPATRSIHEDHGERLSGTYLGLAWLGDSDLVVSHRLDSVGSVDVNAFDGSRQVSVNDTWLSLAKDVQVYHQKDKTFYTLGEAKAKFTRFELFTDRAPAEGGVVQLIAVS